MREAAAAGAKPATYQDILDLPEHEIGEILNGELFTHPRPLPRHDRVLHRLHRILDPFDTEFGPPGGWHLQREPELHLDQDVVIPDMAGWRIERVPHLPLDARIAVVPDWVCEVFSSSTRRYDRIAKAGTYARHGVDWCWWVDPEDTTLEVLRRAGAQWLRVGAYEGAERVSAPPFEGADFRLSRLFEGLGKS